MSKFNPTVLIIGPGGIKGFVYLGGLMRLRDCGLLDNIDHYVGISVGSVISILLVGGFSIERIIVEGLKLNVLSTFTEKEVKLGEVISRVGLIDHELLRGKLGGLFKEKFGTIPTFIELFRLTNKKLTVVSSNLVGEKTVYFNYETFPDLNIVEAVLASVNIPIVFPYFKMGDSLYVDGAISNPYPVDYVDDGKTDIIGIIIHNAFSQIINFTRIPDIFQYLIRCIAFPLREIERMHIEKASSRCRHFILKSNSLSMLGIGLDKEKKILMIVDGYFQVGDLITQFNLSTTPSKSTEDLRTTLQNVKLEELPEIKK